MFCLRSKKIIQLHFFLSGRVLDLRLRGCMFEHHGGCCVVLKSDTLSSG